MSLMIIVLVAAGTIALATVTLTHRDRPASITGFSWERSVDIYTMQWVRRSSYERPPAGSRNHRSETVWETRSIPQSDLTTVHDASGQPQMQWTHWTETVRERRTLHTYEVLEPRYSHTVKKSGTSRDEVVWPRTTGLTGKRRERYTVEFVRLDGKQHTTNVGENRWRTLDENASYLLSVTWYGLVLRIRTKRS